MIKNKLIKILFFCFLGYFCYSDLYGQYRELKFDSYTTDEGLSHSYVFKIVQDKRGFIWIGTMNGLNRFDGLSFKSYFFNTKDSHSIPGNTISDIVKDSADRLWILTSHMFCIYNVEKDNFSRKSLIVNNKKYDNIYLTCGFVDSKGYFWLGAANAIFRFKLYNNPQINNDVIEAEKFDLDEKDVDALNKSIVYSFIEDENKKVWVASFSNNLFYFDEELEKFIPRQIDHPDAKKFSDKQKKIIVDKDGDFVVSIASNGLLIWNRKTNKFNLYKPDGIDTDIIVDLIQDRNGYIWLGRNAGGINIFDKNTGKFTYCTTSISDPNSLLSDEIYNFCEDKTGSMWVATVKGISKYNSLKRKFRSYYEKPEKPDQLSYNNIMCFAEDKSGDIWIGTDGSGLNELQRNTGKLIHFNNLPYNLNSSSGTSVITLCVDHENTLWIGSYNNGLVRKNGNDFHAYYPDPADPYSLGQKHVWNVFEDSKHNLWVGTLRKGLDLLDRKTDRFYHYTYREGDSTSICSNSIFKIFEDSKQNLYIATHRGVSIINLNDYDFSKMPPDIKFHNLIHNEETKNGLSSYDIICTAEDMEGNIWFGTNTAGIDKLDRSTGKFSNYNRDDGLPGNYIYSILVDAYDNLWLATDKGLARFNTKTKEIHVFDRHDGLQNLTYQGYAMKARNEEMFFGGQNGFNSFYPDNIRYNKNIPTVVISGLKLFNKPVAIDEKINNRILLKEEISETKKLVFEHDENFITLNFIALDYITPERNNYAYMMEGFDKDWIYCGTKHEANYTNLNQGKYVFRVKASNNDGFWNESGTSVDIIILPPWWRTWWFISFVVVISMMTVYLLYYLKVLNYKKQQAELSELVKKRTSELEQTNELLIQNQKLIQLQADELQKTNKQLSLSNSAKDRFFSIIAHDLRNPFQSLIGFSELLLLEIEDYTLERTREFLELIHTSSLRGYDLLENLLQWSRAETGSISYEPVILYLDTLAANASYLLEAQAHRKNIQIITEIDPAITVYADENMLNAIFRNLVSNAIKFTDEGGKIIIRSKDAGLFVEISVIDNGVGISEENINLLFNVDNNISTKGTKYESGTGLGLILCKEFVEKHGGKIWVESKEGIGSEFKFTLPASDHQTSK
jgi:signal transduction histidine kinase/ligand-binding sensor domain-containing protein